MQRLTESQYGHWGTPLKIRGWVPPFHKWMNHMSSRVKTAPTTPHRISIEQRLKRWLYFWGVGYFKSWICAKVCPKKSAERARVGGLNRTGLSSWKSSTNGLHCQRFHGVLTPPKTNISSPESQWVVEMVFPIEIVPEMCLLVFMMSNATKVSGAMALWSGLMKTIDFL